MFRSCVRSHFRILVVSFVWDFFVCWDSAMWSQPSHSQLWVRARQGWKIPHNWWVFKPMTFYTHTQLCYIPVELYIFFIKRKEKKIHAINKVAMHSCTILFVLNHISQYKNTPLSLCLSLSLPPPPLSLLTWQAWWHWLFCLVSVQTLLLHSVQNKNKLAQSIT